MRIFAGIFAILGNLNFVSGNRGYAEAWYKKAIDAKTRKSVAYLNYAILVLRKGEWQEAKRRLERGLELRHNVLNDKNMLLTLGTACWVGGDIHGAIKTLERLRSKYEYVNASVLTTLGYMYFLSNTLEKAEELTKLALEDDPHSGAALDNLGQIYFKRGDFAKAKEFFTQATESRANLPDSWYYLGVIAETENDADSARSFYQKAADCEISALNTITGDMVAEKLKALDDTNGGKSCT